MTFFGGIVSRGLLHDLPAGLMTSIWRAISYSIAFSTKRKRVDVLDLRARAELVGALGHHAHVGVAAEVAFLHIAVADPEISHDRVKRAKIGARLLGRSHVRAADDFDQWHAGAVES